MRQRKIRKRVQQRIQRDRRMIEDFDRRSARIREILAQHHLFMQGLTTIGNFNEPPNHC